MVIMGSGAVGVEFASIFRRFGSEVTIIELLPRLVPVEDEAVSAELEKSFRKQGITSHTGTKVTARDASGDGVDIEAQLADGTTQKHPRRLPAGRDRPRTGDRPGSTPKASASQMEKGYIKVDALYRTNVPGISAIGDVITLGTPGASAARARVVGRRHPRRRADRRPGRRGRSTTTTCPGCTYCDPEIGSVGLTEARGEGARLRRARRHVPVRRPRPREDGRRDRGLRQDRRREEVRRDARRPHDRPALDRAGRRGDAGAAARVTVEELIRTIHAHPTMSEAVGEAAHATHGAAIHHVSRGIRSPDSSESRLKSRP